MISDNKKRASRMAGVLMPLASLPSAVGAGSLGKEAYEFVDILADMGMKIWQLLPLNPLGFGNSPYQPFSSFAGDELYVDLGMLEQEGYLVKGGNFGETDLFAGNLHMAERTHTAEKTCGQAEGGHIDYQAVRAYKEPLLRRACRVFYERIAAAEEKTAVKDKVPNGVDAKPYTVEVQAFRQFGRMEWVYPYAVFTALKKQNNLRCWNEWPKEQQDWILDGEYDISHLENEILYQQFLQYMFYKQWKQLKHYANEKGILIMGDIPFYVGMDSLDVWQSREDFLLDANSRPAFVAGVPPDYFSRTGQRWGNPIYNWDYMQANGFAFWLNRLRYNSEMYDIIRIDHFRAFDTFWKIPASCDTAVEGEWIEAPGYELLDRIYEEMPDLWMVAEDLGDLRPEVLILRDHYRLSGMHIAEFSVLGDAPEADQLVYTGTHDNQTVQGWYKELNGKTRRRIRRKLGRYGKPWESTAHKMIRYIVESPAKMAIVPMMDILSLDDGARLNTPGTVGSPNWEWKLENFDEVYRQIPFMKKVVEWGRRL